MNNLRPFLNSWYHRSIRLVLRAFDGNRGHSMNKLAVQNDILSGTMNRRDNLEDDLLVLRAQTGDSGAMAKLVDRWQARLWAFARAMSGNDDAAWEIVQETWLSVVGSLDRLHDATRFRTWVFSIARHKYADSVRKWQRQRESNVSVSVEAAATERQDIRDILGLLPEQDRSLLALHYLEGFEYLEMSAILGVPIGTVKSRLYKARMELKKKLEQING